MLRRSAHFGLVWAVLTAIAWLACTGCNSPAQNPTGSQPPAQVVTVSEVTSADVPIVSEYPAQTYARNSVEVRGRVDGYIDQWKFRPGQQVNSGDVLYVLDQRPYEAAVAQAQGNLAQSDADLEFARKQVALLQAEANLAELNSLQLVLPTMTFDRELRLGRPAAACSSSAI